MQKLVGLQTAFRIVKLKVSKACEMFLPWGLRLDPKGITVSLTVPLFILTLTAKNISSRATFTEVGLGIMGGYIHAVTWQIVDTRQVALLLIFIVVCLF